MAEDNFAKDIVEKDILELIGGNNLSQEHKDTLYSKMLETVKFRVFDRIDASFDDAEALEWKKLVEAGNQDDLKSFYDKKNLDIEQLILDESFKYKVEIVSYIDYLKQTGKAVSDLEDKVGEVIKQEK